MTETRAPGDSPPPTAAGNDRPAKGGGGRDERLAGALRANLARRKSQGRARAAADAVDVDRPGDAGDQEE
ncbi:MAG: hypothetical protein QM699_17770 [Amaricoccus sp.]|uniref:hypothetical protein n=1 Tax=Amaricoccus sp. TaxID=1872485 RepID=UPI0039E425EA